MDFHLDIITIFKMAEGNYIIRTIKDKLDFW